MYWTFFKEIELKIFFLEGFKVEILSDIKVSFWDPIMVITNIYFESQFIFVNFSVKGT